MDREAWYRYPARNAYGAHHQSRNPIVSGEKVILHLKTSTICAFYSLPIGTNRRDQDTVCDLEDLKQGLLKFNRRVVAVIEIVADFEWV